MKRPALIIPVAALVLGCTTVTYKFDPQPVDTIEILVDNDSSVPLYRDDTVELVVIQTANRDILVEVKNNSDTELIVKDTDFIFENSQDGKTWATMKTFSSEEYVVFKKREAAMLAALGTVNATLSVAAQPTPYYSKTQRIMAQETDRQRVNQNLDAAQKSYLETQKALREISTELFYTKRIRPGETGSGAIHAKAMDSSYSYGKYYRITCASLGDSGISFLFIKKAYPNKP